MQNEWEFFFDRHAPRYMEEPFTKNTLEEVDFLLEELALPDNSQILDVGCGTGRHSIELARRGFKMTGVDISQGMLGEARRKAEGFGVEIDFIHADATEFEAKREFDAAICLCEGAFGLLGSEDDPYQHDLSILRNINQALKADGMLILTALNGMQKIRGASQESIEDGSFDPLTLMETFPLEYEDEGELHKVTLRERGFVPSELAMMLRIAGFRVERIWGGTAGSWKRKHVALDEIEVMVIARKEPNSA
jgi:cyclopropane fatty-acyl-phospholipid synthase-like methyltransferase